MDFSIETRRGRLLNSIPSLINHSVYFLLVSCKLGPVVCSSFVSLMESANLISLELLSTTPMASLYL
ncbi:hypothetical protein PGT21_033013, partial [Puccinia graminis f. sp. tritici]